MKCVYCGSEFSDKVCKIHMARCKSEVKEVNKKEEDLRKLAKDNGIKSWHLKSEESLREELQDKGVI